MILHSIFERFCRRLEQKDEQPHKSDGLKRSEEEEEDEEEDEEEEEERRSRVESVISEDFRRDREGNCQQSVCCWAYKLPHC